MKWHRQWKGYYIAYNFNNRYEILIKKDTGVWVVRYFQGSKSRPVKTTFHDSLAEAKEVAGRDVIEEVKLNRLDPVTLLQACDKLKEEGLAPLDEFIPVPETLDVQESHYAGYLKHADPEQIEALCHCLPSVRVVIRAAGRYPVQKTTFHHPSLRRLLGMLHCPEKKYLSRLRYCLQDYLNNPGQRAK